MGITDLECDAAVVVDAGMTKTLADTVIGLVPQDAVVIRSSGWWGPYGEGLVGSIWEAAIYAKDDPNTNRYPMAWEGCEDPDICGRIRHPAVSIFMEAPPPESIVELMANRIRELESDNATLRAILASVPTPEDDQ